jgi:hypothetical protein
MKFSVSLALLMGLVGAAATATASPIPYNINFTGGSPNPTAGSFIYDADSPLFTSFTVIWQGISFDLSAPANNHFSANNAFSGGVCDTVGNNAADAFAYLSNPTCGSGATNDGWTAFQGVGGGFDSFQFYRSGGGGLREILGGNAFLAAHGQFDHGDVHDHGDPRAILDGPLAKRRCVVRMDPTAPICDQHE